MRWRRGCGLAAFGLLVVLIACLVFAALAWGLVLRGEISLYPPQVTAVEPEVGYPFRPTTPLTFTFDRPMDPVSVEASFSLNPAAPGTLYWDDAYRQMTFVPEEGGYRPGATYTFRLLAGAKEATLPRRTQQSMEGQFFLPPLLDAVTPLEQQAPWGPWPLFQATYNFRLDCDATLQTFSVTPAAEGSLECDGLTLTFSPTLPLEPGTQYVVQMENVFLEGDDWPRPGVRWEFQTAPPITIEEAAPAEGESVIDLWMPVRIAFNRPVVTASALERFSLTGEDGAAVPGLVAWEEGGAVLLFQPDAALLPGSVYRFALAPGVRDELGFSLGEDLSRSFRTEPMLEAVLPGDGAVGVPMTETVVISFTRPMDRPSVEAGLVFTPALEGRVTWHGDNLAFVPRAGLDPDTRYEVFLGAEIRDASGAPLARPHRWSFATEPFLQEVRVFQREVKELQQPIGFTFARPMERSSVEAALSIAPETPGTLFWTDKDRSVTFQPDPGWLPGVEYQIALAGSARTADGLHILGQDLTWQFSTAASEVQFGEGPNVQVIATGGARTFQVIFRGADVAEFQVYSIAPTQFLDLYRSGFRGIGPDEPSILGSTGVTPTVTWREPLLPLGDRPYDGWLPAEAHLPADLPAGIYVLTGAAAEEAAEQGNDHLLVILTSHALVLKRALSGPGPDPRGLGGSPAEAQIVAWDTELQGGAPVVSATVELFDRDGALLAEGATNDEGLLTLAVPGDPAPLLALAEKDGDVTVCGLSNEWGEEGWWWWWTQPPSRPLHTVYSYTDRPIYRPGQTVHFKDWIRADDDVSYTLPGPNLPVTVRLRDARDNIAATQVLTPTLFGTVHGEFQLAEEPMLGTWNLETVVEDTVARQPFKVEEYRKPEYEVRVDIPQATYVHGDAISVTIAAEYYFAQPVAGAKVELVVYPALAEDDYWPVAPDVGFGYPILSEEGRTDAQGRWSLSVPSDDVFYAGSQAPRAALALEATVTDDAGQSVSSYETVVVLRSAQGLTLLLDRNGYQPNETIRLSARLHDLQGAPVTGAELQARILGWDDREVAGASATTDEDGQAQFSVSLSEQGWYQVRVTGKDDRGRELRAEDYVWVYDPGGGVPWYGGQWTDAPRLSVSADRSLYQVGEQAQLLVYSPVPGPALLSFERGETHGVRPVTLVSGTNLITIPVRADYAPNIYVTVNQFGPLLDEEWWLEQSRPEAGLQTASVQLQVPMADRLLTVTLTSAQEVYSPGDEATFDVQVTDQAGQPVVAEVSLAVVDEAIFALAEDLSQDPFEVFYAPRSNVVQTFDSLKPTRWLYPEGPGLGGGDAEAVGAPRRDFRDTAYWAPGVVTDENGEATITFDLPDNLTEWRVLARAVTTDTLVGQASTGILVSQDIVVRPALPRFLVQGDAITLTAVVHNYTAQAVSATVTLDIEGLVAAEDRKSTGGQSGVQVVHVTAGGSATAGWPVLARDPGEAHVAVQVVATYGGARLAGRDAVELSLPVLPLTVPEVVAFAGQLLPAQPTATVTIPLPSDAAEGLSRLEVNLAPSIAPGLLGGLEYLIDYPFG